MTSTDLLCLRALLCFMVTLKLVNPLKQILNSKIYIYWTLTRKIYEFYRVAYVSIKVAILLILELHSKS